MRVDVTRVWGVKTLVSANVSIYTTSKEMPMYYYRICSTPRVIVGLEGWGQGKFEMSTLCGDDHHFHQPPLAAAKAIVSLTRNVKLFT